MSEPKPAVSDFEALTREHEPALRAVALRLCRGPSDAQDLVQDTFERALKGLPKLPPGARMRSWLLTILKNRFIDACRQKARMSPEPPPDDVPATEPDPEPRWASVTPEQVRAALTQLPDEFRIAYELHAVEHKSYAEIAAALNIPKATVGTRLLRARRKLRSILMQEEDEE